MELTPAQHQTLLSAMDRLIPADEFVGAIGSGAMGYVQKLFDIDAADKATQLRAGLDGLNAESSARFGENFANVSAANQDAVLADVEAAVVRSTWATPPELFFQLLLNVTSEAFYANAGGGVLPASWVMIGYDPRANRP